jgi:hypothetical protein
MEQGAGLSGLKVLVVEVPDSAVLPSAESTTEVREPKWPVRVRISRPVASLQSLSVLSSLPDGAGIVQLDAFIGVAS